MRLYTLLRKLLPTAGSPFGVEESLSTLKRLGFRCDCCVDVGAYQGEWTRIVKRVFPSTRVVMVEAQPSKKSLLERVAGEYRDVEVEIKLLGPVTGETVNFHEMETGSSVLAEHSPFPRQTVERTTLTLDDLLKARSDPKVDLLKMDVQGYELSILKGASRILPTVAVIVLEASLLPINSGCPLFAEVIGALDGYGFQLFDIFGYTRRKDGVLWQTDLVFLRKDVPFRPSPELNAGNW